VPEKESNAAQLYYPPVLHAVSVIYVHRDANLSLAQAFSPILSD